MGSSRLVLIVLISVGCGRVGFGATVGDAGATDDSAPISACTADLDCGLCERCGVGGVCAAEPINQVFAGHQSTCFLGEAGSRWCVGTGTGIPGAKPLVPARIVGEDGWTSLALGYGDGGSLGTRNGQIWAWRNDEAPHLLGEDPGLAQIANEDGTACVRTAGGDLFCDGVQVAGTWTWIDEGFAKRCGVQGGRLYCWGADDAHALGLGDLPAGTVVAAPEQVGTDSDWVEVATGLRLSCARKANNTLWCWGEPALFTPSVAPSTLGRPVQISNDVDWQWLNVHWDRACAGKPGDRVFCWGQGDGHDVVPGQGLATTPTELPGTWEQLVMGGHHYCGRTAGVWYCWGNSDQGRIGLGDEVTRNAPSTPLCRRVTPTSAAR